MGGAQKVGGREGVRGCCWLGVCVAVSHPAQARLCWAWAW